MKYFVLIVSVLLCITTAYAQDSEPEVMGCTTPACIGQWTAPMPSGPPGNPTVVVHMAVLPNGKVFLWSRAGAAGGGENGSEPTMTWNPANNQYEVGPHIDDIFCSGHALLPDGRLLVAGGTLEGAAVVSPYNGVTKTWGAPVQMNNDRYYPSNLPLANGEQLMIAGGAGKVNGKNVENTIPQVWTTGNTLRTLSGAHMKFLQYPWLSLAPDGRVFISGPQPSTYFLNTTGNGSLVSGPSAHSVWNTFRVAGVPVTYRPGKILITGGANGVAGGTVPRQTTNTAETIDLNQSPPHWVKAGSMAKARVDHMAFVLPTGDVLVAGGTTGFGGFPGLDETAGHDPDESKAVLTPELWNPGQPGTWQKMATMSKPRMYHSTGALLPDGRVYVGGGGKKDGFTDQRTAEIFSPPYLFKGSRPVINGVLTQAGNNVIQYGETITVTTGATNIARATLVRLPSTTHSLDFNQRFYEFALPVAVAGGVRLTAPGSGTIAPPGHYYLFVINTAGMPSVAKIIKIQ